MNAKVMEIANEMLAEAGGDIGQEFQAATNTQLRAWAERLMEAAKEEGGVNRKLAREALKAALPWLADTCCEITKDARDALRLVEKALEEPERNFDRFDTAAEAQAAFFRLCNGRHSCGPHCWYHPIDLKAACSFRFLYDTKPHDWSDVTKEEKA